MNHEEVKIRFNEYLAHELSAVEQKQVEEHLDACADCQNALKEHQGYLELLEGTVASLRPSDEWKKNVVEMARATPVVRPWTAGRILAYAATLLLAFGVSFWVGNSLFQNPTRKTHEVMAVDLQPPALNSFGHIEASSGAQVAVIDAKRIQQDSGSVLYQFAADRLATIQTPGGMIELAQNGAELRVAVFENASQFSNDPELKEKKFELPKDSEPKAPFVLIAMRAGTGQLTTEKQTQNIHSGEFFLMNNVSGIQLLGEKKETPVEAPEQRVPVQENVNVSSVEGILSDEKTGKSIADGTIYLVGIQSDEPSFPSTLAEVRQRLVRQEVKTDSAGHYQLKPLSDGFYILGSAPQNDHAVSLGGAIFVGTGLVKERKQIAPLVQVAAMALNQKTLKFYELAPKSRTEIPIRVSLAGSLSGKVQGKDGEKISDAEIFVFPNLPQIGSLIENYLPDVIDFVKPLLARGKSDAQGNYKIEGILGPVTVYAKAPGYFMGKIYTQISEGDEEEETIELESIKTRWTIRGKILDTERNPISGARVFFAKSDDEFHSRFEPSAQVYFEEHNRHTTSSAKDGSFAFEQIQGFARSGWNSKSDLSAGGFQLYAMADGYASRWSQDELLPKDPIEGMELILFKGGTLEGKILSAEDGKPIQGASVTTFMKVGTEGSNTTRTKSNKIGKFVLSEVPFSGGDLNVSKEGYEAASIPFNFQEGKALAPFEIRLKKAGWMIQGRVVTPNGQPAPQFLQSPSGSCEVPYFFVYALSDDPENFAVSGIKKSALKMDQATMKEDGKFTIQIDSTKLVKGPKVWVGLLVAGKLEETQEVSRESGEIRLTVDPQQVKSTASWLTVGAVEEKKGAAIYEFNIAIFPQGRAEGVDVVDCSKAGLAYCKLNQPGVYDVLVSAKGLAPGWIRGVQVSAGAETSPVYARLGVEGKIRGHVVVPGKAQKESNYAQVIAWDAGGHFISSSWTDKEGHFLLLNLIPGETYSLRFNGWDSTEGWVRSLEATAVAGEGSELVVELHPPQRVNVQFSEELNKKLVGGVINILDSKKRIVKYFSHLEKFQTFTVPLEPGNYELRVWSPQVPLISKAFELKADAPAEVFLDLETK